MKVKSYRIGIDVGGTFTDGVIIDSRNGDIEIDKVPSTPTDPSEGFMNCVSRLLTKANAQPDEVDSIIHGTTVATNAVFELQLARTGLITNAGFTDILEVGRMDRPKLFDLLQERPIPLVPGKWRRAVRCRINIDGEVLQNVIVSDVEGAVEIFKRDAVEAIAICFLHSYKNPVHELEVERLVHELYPEAYVCSSFEVVPLHGETARMSTTVINAGLMPIVGRYLARVERRLSDLLFEGDLYLLQSNGGTIRSEKARRYPAWMIESGPAAGVIGAAYLGKLLGIDNIVSFDMGGTTAKVGLVKSGQPEFITEFEVGSMVRTKTYETGGGYPLRTPAIDLAEVGAGGGSIGWLDAGGALRVGPKSAGAVPGPACYNSGGQDPTVSDANLVIGKLNPENFLGGEMILRSDLAEQAIQKKLAEPLGKSTTYCAQGVLEVANANMGRIMKVISTMRGYDLRDYAVVAFGGSGPVHIASLADELHIKEIIIPPNPGVFTSIGLLLADLKHDYTQALVQREDEIDLRLVRQAYKRMEKEAKSVLDSEGVPPDKIRWTRAAELRYVGQLYTLTVPVPATIDAVGWLAQVLKGFHETHKRLYGHAAAGEEPVELVALRLTAVGSLMKPKFREMQPNSNVGRANPISQRSVIFSVGQQPLNTDIYNRAELLVGQRIGGPAIIEQFDSTVVIPKGFETVVDRFGNLIVTAVC
jgi:N-methylhydantoinase A